MKKIEIIKIIIKKMIILSLVLISVILIYIYKNIILDFILDKNNTLSLIQSVTTVSLGIAAYWNGYIANKVNKDIHDRELKKQRSQLELNLVKLIHVQKNIRIICEEIESSSKVFSKRINSLKEYEDKELKKKTYSYMDDFIESKNKYLQKLEFISIEYMKTIEGFSENIIANLEAKIYAVLYTQWNYIDIAKQNTIDIINRTKKNSMFEEQNIAPNDIVWCYISC